MGDDSSALTPRWYLPIHVDEKKPGKTRVCHDGRAPVGGVCLNDLLLGGPNLMNPLPEVLMHFQSHRVAFMVDIVAFFHQVLVDERDVDAFRYFWWADEQCQKIVLKRFKAHIFGSGASSCVTSFVLRHHADAVKDLFPPVIHDLIRHLFYVDDGSAGADDLQSALAIKADLIAAMRLGGFELSKWKSNFPELADAPVQ